MNDLPFEAIIFDMDGTLIDTESADFRACQMLYEELGMTLLLNEWAKKIVGSTDGYHHLFEELARQSNDGLTPDNLWQRIRQLWQVTFQDIGLMPGVESLLPKLQTAGYSLGLASASDREWVNRWLTHFNLNPYFQVIATGDDITHNKPAPDIFLFAATQLQVDPKRCLVFEDTAQGVMAAKSAGMTVIAVPNLVTKTLDFSRADEVTDGLENVTIEWLQQLGNCSIRH